MLKILEFVEAGEHELALNLAIATKREEALKMIVNDKVLYLINRKDKINSFLVQYLQKRRGSSYCQYHCLQVFYARRTAFLSNEKNEKEIINLMRFLEIAMPKEFQRLRRTPLKKIF